MALLAIGTATQVACSSRSDDDLTTEDPLSTGAYGYGHGYGHGYGYGHHPYGY